MTTSCSSAHAASPRPWHVDLVHPLPLLAVATLALNDHVLKGSGLLPGAVTGKLSDLCGLFFFPLLLAAVVRIARPSWAGRSLDAAAALATAAGFAAVKTVPAVNAWIAATWGPMVMDPSDLLALPCAGLAWLFARRRGPTSGVWGGPLVRFLGLAGAAAASIATSPPRHPPDPRLRPPTQTEVKLAGCFTQGASSLDAELQFSSKRGPTTIRVGSVGARVRVRPDLEVAAVSEPWLGASPRALPIQSAPPVPLAFRFELPTELADPTEVLIEVQLIEEDRLGAPSVTATVHGTCTRKAPIPVAQ